MVKRNRSKADNLLAGQKPGRKKYVSKRRLRLLIVRSVQTAALIAITTAILLLWQKNPWNGWLQSPADERSWNVSFVHGKNQARLEEQRRKIPAYVNRLLRNGEIPVKDLAARLQRKFQAETVSVMKLRPYHLLVEIIPRSPVARILADRKRLVSGNGLVYGRADERKGRLPLLTGFLPTDPGKLRWNSDASLNLKQDTRQRIRTALDLREQLRRSNIRVDRIHHVPFRGYGATVHPEGIQVTLGSPPFAHRIRRLREILLRLKRTGDLATRIELDYNGKAFVKTRQDSNCRNSEPGNICAQR